MRSFKSVRGRFSKSQTAVCLVLTLRVSLVLSFWINKALKNRIVVLFQLVYVTFKLSSSATMYITFFKKTLFFFICGMLNTSNYN